MRHRIEDLGRLAVLIELLLDHGIFDEKLIPIRRRDYWEWFSNLPDVKKEEIFRTWVFGIQYLKDKLCEFLAIAEGRDLLNARTDTDIGDLPF